MNNQGFIGAIVQYFTIEDKPRLYRRNSWFRDHGISEEMTIHLFIVFFSVVIGLMIFGMVGFL